MIYKTRRQFVLKFTLTLILTCTIVLAGIVNAESAPFHIGVMTGTVSQSEDDLRGAEVMIERYGDTSHGGMITHVTYPDNFSSEQETTISQLLGLADDPLMKVIVVNQAVPGTAEAFRRIRERRNDILLIAGSPHEDPGVISEIADISVDPDNIARGYTIPLAAKKIGAKTFVHISFPRHMSYETLGLRRVIMEKVCEDLGIKFVFETAPDPIGDVGMAGAQQFILENVPVWIEKYGKDAEFFCTNDGQTEPLIRQVANLGGYFVVAASPSPLMGYPGALGIDLSEEKGNWPAILKKIEDAVIKAGGGGRMGTWAYSWGYSASAALIEYGKRYVEGTVSQKLGTLKALQEMRDVFSEFSPGAKWGASYYVDAGTGMKNNRFILLNQDIYIFGKGYLGLAEVEIPEKYLHAKVK
ncbi:MAG: DUF3798 domain-containing protein [Synergistaceae bacterium]|nr:DUF3798 domain-containing protein [Achromobacter sp.]MBQ6983223.1 DUF3798 domain-containing protein [Synergistaceae bacterium]